jgi:flagellar biosynthesis GTPase FlhF
MIKLYFIRQLEDHDGIDAIPRLDAFCVETAFDEMRAEGYEDDGLFKDMKLFFQPLTVTDDELTINPKLLEKLKKEENAKKEILGNQIEELNTKWTAEDKKLKGFNQELDTLKEQSKKNYQQLKSDLEKPENKSYQKQKEVERAWSEENQKIQKNIKLQNKKIDEQKKQILDIETKKITDENLLKIIEQNLATQNTKIDRKLVKPHRGFIMYGPPGKCD